MSKILVVDDEADIRGIITEYLSFAGFDYVEANDGEEALAHLNQEAFDLVVLDIMMPKIDGITVLKEIRKKWDIPVILLTARGEEYDKLFGFDAGADDYVIKPFSPKELLARIKTVLKRSQHYHLTAATEEPICGDLLINRAARTVTLKKKQLNLTPKEFDLLFFLYKNKNVALSRNQILDEVWGELFDGDDRTVDTHIKMLRNNLGEYRNIIKTVWGIGYKLETNDSISPNPNES